VVPAIFDPRTRALTSLSVQAQSREVVLAFLASLRGTGMRKESVRSLKFGMLDVTQQNEKGVLAPLDDLPTLAYAFPNLTSLSLVGVRGYPRWDGTLKDLLDAVLGLWGTDLKELRLRLHFSLTLTPRGGLRNGVLGSQRGEDQSAGDTYSSHFRPSFVCFTLSLIYLRQIESIEK